MRLLPASFAVVLWVVGAVVVTSATTPLGHTSSSDFDPVVNSPTQPGTRSLLQPSPSPSPQPSVGIYTGNASMLECNLEMCGGYCGLDLVVQWENLQPQTPQFLNILASTDCKNWWHTGESAGLWARGNSRTIRKGCYAEPNRILAVAVCVSPRMYPPKGEADIKCLSETPDVECSVLGGTCIHTDDASSSDTLPCCNPIDQSWIKDYDRDHFKACGADSTATVVTVVIVVVGFLVVGSIVVAIKVYTRRKYEAKQLNERTALLRSKSDDYTDGSDSEASMVVSEVDSLYGTSDDERPPLPVWVPRQSRPSHGSRLSFESRPSFDVLRDG